MTPRLLIEALRLLRAAESHEAAHASTSAAHASAARGPVASKIRQAIDAVEQAVVMHDRRKVAQARQNGSGSHGAARR